MDDVNGKGTTQKPSEVKPATISQLLERVADLEKDLKKREGHALRDKEYIDAAYKAFEAIQETVLKPMGFYIESRTGSEYIVCFNLNIPSFSNRAQAVSAALDKAKELGLMK